MQNPFFCYKFSNHFTIFKVVIVKTLFLVPHITITKAAVTKDYSTDPGTHANLPPYSSWLAVGQVWGGVAEHNGGILYCGGTSSGNVYRDDCLHFCPNRYWLRLALDIMKEY